MVENIGLDECTICSYLNLIIWKKYKYFVEEKNKLNSKNKKEFIKFYEVV